MYLSNGNDDDGLQSARTTFKSFEVKTVNRGKKHVETNSDSVGDETQLEIRKETIVEEENVGTTCELDGNETDYFDSDDHGSLVSLDDDEHDDAAWRKTRFPKYNPNLETLEFCLGMLFTDGKQFKEAIRKYSKTMRMELKIINNEPKRVIVKCTASAHFPWRIHTITNIMTRCMQMRRSRSSNDQTPSSHKGKEKVNTVKPKPRRSTRLEVFDLHTNLDTGEQTLYVSTSKLRTQYTFTSLTIVSPKIQQSDARKKRKVVGEHLATQESVATKMKKK
ncbi:hypothetical protein GQ457_06G016460 [Hibiscus cannabinus]